MTYVGIIIENNDTHMGSIINLDMISLHGIEIKVMGLTGFSYIQTITQVNSLVFWIKSNTT